MQIDIYDLTPTQWCAMKQGIAWSTIEPTWIWAGVVVLLALIIAAGVNYSTLLEYRQKREATRRDEIRDAMRTLETSTPEPLLGGPHGSYRGDVDPLRHSPLAQQARR
jgi:hypothetical protein